MGESMRQFYASRFPTVAEERWLPKAFDDAVAGMVERGDQLLPAYLFSSLLDCAPQPEPSEKFRRVMEALAAHPHVAVLYTRVARDHFWEEVRKGRKIVWEGLTPAIKGQLAFGPKSAHAVVYDRASVIAFLDSAIMNSDLGGEDPAAVALRDYQNKILPCYAGEATPWYFFTL
jgi:hypothetical protein